MVTAARWSSACVASADVSDEDFARDAGLVQADLTRLKQVVESTG